MDLWVPFWTFRNLLYLEVLTITQTRGIVSFAEANEIIIGPKAVKIPWPVLSDCWRSVELAEIPIEICTFGALAAFPDHLLLL